MMQTQSVRVSERSLNSIGITTETAGGTCRSFKELIDLIRKGPVSAKHRWQILCDSMSNEEVWEESVVYTDHYDDKMIPWCSPNEVQSSTFVRVTSFKIQTLEKPPGATSPLQLFAHMGSARLSLSQVVMDPILRYLLVDYFGLTVQFLEDLTDGETQPSCWLDEKFCEEDFDMNTVAGARYMDRRITEELLSRATHGISPPATDGVLSRATDEALSRARVQHSWNWVPKRILELWDWVCPGAFLRATPRPKAFVGSDVA